MSARTAIESIEEATVEARAGGHNLGGFVRRCNSAGYGFFARCRVCRIEVAVHRGPAGWGHSLEASDCQPADAGGTSTPSLPLSNPGSRVGARQTP
ncbi:MAG TPA: hypothetical protein VH134_15970 [Candidatus Dormibacteraeota bacterium]|jgi:hypothetical protein|nr:hypothetical protein [Candidatus Dormibacteraeota bacterium]